MLKFFKKNRFFKNILYLFFIILLLKYIHSLSVYNFYINMYIFEWIIILFTFLSINYLGTIEFFKVNIISSLLFSLILIFSFLDYNFFQKIFVINFGNFFKLNSLKNISINFYIDFISYNFSLLTACISVCVYIYVYVYMRFELNIINFFFFLKAFVLSMILLVWSGNWINLILGWELIGITSFLLINFWSIKITTLKSAFKAFAFNKFSDCFLIISFLLALQINGVFFFNFFNNYSLFLYKYIYVFSIYINYTELLLLSLIICSFCKSAQFGFHFWLPDSMEAPVPASALIHSATLVSAGIYLLLRFNFLFIFSQKCFIFFSIITSFTALFGSIIASFQTDVKKILAYSTISHCGFLMVSIIFFNPTITILYLFGHGFFKSLNFMCAGNLIIFSGNYQDFRKMGGYLYKQKFEFYIMFICIFNLGSLPFFFNFFTKHFLLNSINLNFNINFLILLNLFLAAFCGIFYTIKIFYFCFLNFKKTHYIFYTIKELKLNTLFFLVFNTSKLNIISIFILYNITLLLLCQYIYLIYLNIITLLDSFSVQYYMSALNLNNFFIKIIFYFFYINIFYLNIFFKKNNYKPITYIWVFYLFILVSLI